jgi:hypothetical protein
MSCNWRPELDSAVREEPFFELRGVKKRVNRFGVIGGGRLGLRLPIAAEDMGGGDEHSSGVGSWRSLLRVAHGDDMFNWRYYKTLGWKGQSGPQLMIKRPDMGRMEMQNWAEVGDAHWPGRERGRACTRRVARCRTCPRRRFLRPAGPIYFFEALEILACQKSSAHPRTSATAETQHSPWAQ